MMNCEPLPQIVTEQGTPFDLPPGPIRLIAEPAEGLFQILGDSGLAVSADSGAYPVRAGLLSMPIGQEAAAAGQLSVEPLPSEGYRLSCAPGGSNLVAADPAALRYGAQTLAQLLAQGSSVPSLRISDWPELPFRGLMLTLRQGPTEMATLEYLVDQMDRYRLNCLVLEIDRGMKWESHPEVAASWALDKGIVERFVQRLKERGIEFIPLIPTLNHVSYIVQAHPELAEGPDTYCPNHPASLRLAQDLLAEAIELCQPRFVHVGHDEVISDYELTRRATVRSCPRCLAQEPHRWFAAHICRLHDWLSSQNVGTMMWADMLLDHPLAMGCGTFSTNYYGGPPDRICRCLDLLPKDIVLCDWQYEVNRDYPSYDYLLEKGFTVLGAPYSLESIFSFTRKIARTRAHALPAVAQRSPGALCTYWGLIGADQTSALGEHIRGAGEFTWTPGRAAYLPADLVQIAALMDKPNPTRDMPAGPFVVVFDLSAKGRGYMWAAGTNTRMNAEGLALKSHRTGFLYLQFTTAPGCSFAAARLSCQGNPTTKVAVRLNTGGAEPAWPVGDKTLLSGEPVDLTSWVQGARLFAIRFDLRNETEELQIVLRRLQVEGEVVCD